MSLELLLDAAIYLEQQEKQATEGEDKKESQSTKIVNEPEPHVKPVQHTYAKVTTHLSSINKPPDVPEKIVKTHVHPATTAKLLPPHFSPPTRLDTRQIAVSPVPTYYERGSPRSTSSPGVVRPRDDRTARRPQFSATSIRTNSPANLRTEVPVFSNNVSPRTAIPLSTVAQTSPQSTSSTASSDSNSSLGLASAFRGSGGYESTGYVARPLPIEATSLSRLTSSGGEPYQAHINGITRPNGASKTLSLPISMNSDIDDGSGLLKEDPNKKRSGTTPSREVHNKLEKNRRAHLKECFEMLRKQLPLEDKKISNQTILKAALRHIQNLKRKEREYEHEMERLARQKIANQQNLATLKKELSARWDHIDFSAIMPDMTTIEQQQDKETKSTTTASEQPDFEDNTEPFTLPSVNVTGDTQSFTLADNTITVTTVKSEPNPIGYNNAREHYPDINQPLNLSTSPIESRCSPRRLPSPIQSPKSTNGDWSASLIPPSQGVVYSQRIEGETWATHSPITTPQGGTRIITAPSHQAWSSPTTVVRTLPTVTTSVVRSLPSTGNTIIRNLPLNSAVPVRAVAQTLPGTIKTVPVVTSSIRSPTSSSSTVSSCISDNPQPHTMPIMGTSGLLPAQLVTNSVHLNGTTGSIIGQPAIQVIPPEGYKLLSDHTSNGAKPLTITLAHTDGLERGFGEDGKTGPVMVTVNKNGLPALHLAVPTSARSITHSQGSGSAVPVTSVPLNLTVSGSTSVKMTQSGSTPLMQSYVPVAHANGITQLVPSMSLVGPLMMSQSQRGTVVPATVVSVGAGGAVNKAIKTSVVGGTTVPLVPAHYATTLPGGAIGGLVNSVVVVSAPGGVGLVPTNQTIVSTSSNGVHSHKS